jgi:hypothetical protein
MKVTFQLLQEAEALEESFPGGAWERESLGTRNSFLIKLTLNYQSVSKSLWREFHSDNTYQKENCWYPDSCPKET